MLWRALDGSHGIQDFVGLGLGNPRSPEGHHGIESPFDYNIQ